jgi:hypothetical protein
MEKNEKVLETMDKNWDEYVPLMLMFDSSRKEVGQSIRKHFFNDHKPLTSDLGGFLKNFTQMMSEGHFYQGVHKSAKYHSKSAPVYLYYYDYRSSLPSLYSAFRAVNPKDFLHSKIKLAGAIIHDYYKYLMGYPGPHEYGKVLNPDYESIILLFM